MGQNLERLNRDIVRMKVAAEVEVLDFLGFSQASNLVGIRDQTSRYSFAARESWPSLRDAVAAWLPAAVRKTGGLWRAHAALERRPTRARRDASEDGCNGGLAGV